MRVTGSACRHSCARTSEKPTCRIVVQSSKQVDSLRTPMGNCDFMPYTVVVHAYSLMREVLRIADQRDAISWRMTGILTCFELQLPVQTVTCGDGSTQGHARAAPHWSGEKSVP